MIETNIPEINVDELMEKIRAEVRQRKERGGTLHRTVPPANYAPPSNLYAKVDLSKIGSIPEPEPFEYKEEGYHINDFLKYHDQHFVINAYRGILRRGPDSEALQYFLKNLRSGKMTKAEVLGRLRYAPEGRAAKVKISGLLWNFTIQSSFRIPVLGYCSRLATGIVNLPVIIRNMQVLEENAFTQLQQQGNDLNNALGQLGSGLERKADRQELEVGLDSKADRQELEVGLDSKADRQELEAGLERKADRQELETGLERKADRQELEAGLERKADRQELEVGLDSKAEKEQIEPIKNEIREILRQTRDHKLNIIDQQRRLKLLLEEARKRLPEPLSTGQIKKMVKEEDHLLDAAYVSFEDQFRGTREDIKERQKIYLPYIRKSGAGEKKSPLLDIGCGRGEWLEVLEEEEFVAQGIDINSVLVEECRGRGSEVVEGDAIEYLRSLTDASIGAVTGFHIIEHLPFGLLVALLDETVRILKSGGVAIFETPNPENILVSAFKYYFDPTHRNPLPPGMIKFLVESRGLCQVEVLRLHPDEPSSRLQDDGSEIVERFNEYFYGPQDYAVVGYKA